MRFRTLQVLSLTIPVVVLAAVGSAARASESALEQGARKEGQVTWYVSQLDNDTAHQAAAAFMKRYPGITVNTVRMTTQVAYQRVLQELAHQDLQCDVYSTADVGQYARMAPKGDFAKYRPPNVAKLGKQFQNFDPSGYYYPTSSGLVVVVYNKLKVTAAQAPKRWHDLINEKWKNELTAGSPLFGAYAGNWAVLMDELYGWKYFEALKRNNPLVTRAGGDTVSFLNSGERWVSVSPAAMALVSIARGNPLEVVYPTEGSVLMIVPSAVMAKAPHPNAARLFLNFMLSAGFQGVLEKNWFESIRPDVPAMPGMKPLSEIKTVHLDRKTVEAGIPAMIKKWRDLFGI